MVMNSPYTIGYRESNEEQCTVSDKRVFEDSRGAGFVYYQSKRIMSGWYWPKANVRFDESLGARMTALECGFNR
jgi:hypothetical protein